MVELSLHDVQWSREQGYPVLILHVEGEASGTLTIALSPGDAQLLSSRPPTSGLERLRLFGLIETITNGFSAQLQEIRLRLEPSMVLAADLFFASETHEFIAPASFADAMVLAKRADAPLLIDEHELRVIRAAQSANAAGRRTVHSSDPNLSHSMVAFIESLQLDDLPGPAD